MHIMAAKAYFTERQEFADLPLVPAAGYEPRNDAALQTYLEALAVTPQGQPCVGVFDRDSKLAAKFIGNDGWLNLGNGVVAVSLAPPPWRSEGDPVCIEMLFPTELLALVDNEGRRLFLAEEFLPSGVHESRLYVTPHPTNSKLVREEVYDIESDESVGLAKVAFARAASNRTPPLVVVDYGGFRPTFEIIRRAVGEAWGDIRRNADRARSTGDPG